MPNLYTQWSAAKTDFAKSKALFPPEVLTGLDKGAGLGPALKTLDKAKSYEDRAKALMPVRAAKQKYDTHIKAALNTVGKKDSAAHKALTRLEKNLLSIWAEADESCQPPKPGGGNVPYEVLRSFTLGGALKPKYLDITATRIDVVIDIDKTLDDMIKSGEESLKIGHLGDVAKAEVEKIGSAFSDTIKTVDAKIATLDPTEQEKKIQEANEVLKHYAQLVENRVNAAVQAEWNAYLSRKSYLSAFRLKCGIKVVMGVVAIGAAAASAALTFGALWMNIVGMVKAISDMAQTIKTWAQDLDTVYAGLLTDIASVHELNQQREEAKKKGEGQKASKAKEAAKEVITGLLPISKNMLKSASDIENRAKQLLGLVSKLETQSDKLTAQLHLVTKQMTKLPEKQMTAELRKDADKLDQVFQKLFADITDLHRRSQNCAHFGERALKAVQTLRKEDSWSAGLAESATGLGTKGAALFAVANFGFECAKHGASLLAAL